MQRLVRALRISGIHGLRLKCKRIQPVPQQRPPQPDDRSHPGRSLFRKKGQALVSENDADTEIGMPQAAWDKLSRYGHERETIIGVAHTAGG